MSVVPKVVSVTSTTVGALINLNEEVKTTQTTCLPSSVTALNLKTSLESTWSNKSTPVDEHTRTSVLTHDELPGVSDPF